MGIERKEVKMERLMISLVVVVLLSGMGGCATPYKKTGFGGGYYEMKVQDDIFKVGFSGNAYIGSDRVKGFTLLRCAEVALENGYCYFVILDEDSYITQRTITTRSREKATVYDYYGFPHGRIVTTVPETTTYSKPSASNLIQCFKEKPFGISTVIYDAEQVKTNLRNQYGIK
jgi:hypothetical protein